RKIGRTADGRKAGDLNLRCSIIERCLACIGQACNAKPLNHVGVPVLLQAIETESRVTDAGFIHKTRGEDMRPHRHRVLSSLQLVTSESGYISRRTKRIRQGIELRRVREFV